MPTHADDQDGRLGVPSQGHCTSHVTQEISGSPTENLTNQVLSSQPSANSSAATQAAAPSPALEVSRVHPFVKRLCLHHHRLLVAFLRYALSTETTSDHQLSPVSPLHKSDALTSPFKKEALQGRGFLCQASDHPGRFSACSAGVLHNIVPAGSASIYPCLASLPNDTLLLDKLSPCQTTNYTGMITSHPLNGSSEVTSFQSTNTCSIVTNMPMGSAPSKTHAATTLDSCTTVSAAAMKANAFVDLKPSGEIPQKYIVSSKSELSTLRSVLVQKRQVKTPRHFLPYEASLNAPYDLKNVTRNVKSGFVSSSRHSKARASKKFIFASSKGASTNCHEGPVSSCHSLSEELLETTEPQCDVVYVSRPITGYRKKENWNEKEGNIVMKVEKPRGLLGAIVSRCPRNARKSTRGYFTDRRGTVCETQTTWKAYSPFPVQDLTCKFLSSCLPSLGETSSSTSLQPPNIRPSSPLITSCAQQQNSLTQELSSTPKFVALQNTIISYTYGGTTNSFHKASNLQSGQNYSALPPHSGALPPHSGALPPHSGALPPHSGALPPHSGALPPHSGALPPHSGALPPHSGALPPHSGALPPHSGALPPHSGALPPHSGALPPHSGALPPHSGALPPHSGALPPHSGKSKLVHFPSLLLPTPVKNCIFIQAPTSSSQLLVTRLAAPLSSSSSSDQPVLYTQDLRAEMIENGINGCKEEEKQWVKTESSCQQSVGQHTDFVSNYKCNSTDNSKLVQPKQIKMCHRVSFQKLEQRISNSSGTSSVNSCDMESSDIKTLFAEKVEDAGNDLSNTDGQLANTPDKRCLISASATTNNIPSPNNPTSGASTCEFLEEISSVSKIKKIENANSPLVHNMDSTQEIGIKEKDHVGGATVDGADKSRDRELCTLTCDNILKVSTKGRRRLMYVKARKLLKNAAERRIPAVKSSHYHRRNELERLSMQDKSNGPCWEHFGLMGPRHTRKSRSTNSGTEGKVSRGNGASINSPEQLRESDLKKSPNKSKEVDDVTPQKTAKTIAKLWRGKGLHDSRDKCVKGMASQRRDSLRGVTCSSQMDLSDGGVHGARDESTTVACADDHENLLSHSKGENINSGKKRQHEKHMRTDGIAVDKVHVQREGNDSGEWQSARSDSDTVDCTLDVCLGEPSKDGNAEESMQSTGNAHVLSKRHQQILMTLDRRYWEIANTWKEVDMQEAMELEDLERPTEQAKNTKSSLPLTKDKKAEKPRGHRVHDRLKRIWITKKRRRRHTRPREPTKSVLSDYSKLSDCLSASPTVSPANDCYLTTAPRPVPQLFSSPLHVGHVCKWLLEESDSFCYDPFPNPMTSTPDFPLTNLPSLPLLPKPL
uniref:Uncharacterized protein n=1 Tax=Eptatretus burgeri TaxID=7764 RepID=A0A8C4QN91_EPTBU